MKVTSQKEWDALPASFNTFTVIEIHSPAESWLSVSKIPTNSRVEAWGSSRVEAWGSSRVEAWGSSRVEAWESSHVVAWGSSRVEASGECGDGKFHACSRPYFYNEFRSNVGDRYIAIEVALKDLFAWDGGNYPHKIGFRKGTVLYECDRYGAKIS